MAFSTPRTARAAQHHAEGKQWLLAFASVLLLALALCAMLPHDSAHADTVNAYVDGTFYAEDMQTALTQVNTWRKEACDEGVPDPRNASKKLAASDYVEIKWSKDMEEIARQRAAEACLAIRHARPSAASKSDSITAFDVVSSTGKSANAENLAWNRETEDKATMYGLKQWYDEKTDWVNQTEGKVTGHYTSLINPDYNYFGLACLISSCGRYPSTLSGEFFQKGSNLDQTHLPTVRNASTEVSINTANITSASIDASSCPNKQLTIGDTKKLNAKITTNFDGYAGSVRPVNVAWSADNNNLSITSTGEITGNAAGETNVTATAAGKSASTAITVKRAQDSVSFENASPIEKLVHDENFAVKASAASGKSVSYSSQNPDVATVDGDGTVTITGAGTTDIKAYTTQSNTHEAAEATIVLTVNKRDANLWLPNATRTATYGDEPFALDARRDTDFDTEALTYASSDNNVATVADDGTVTIAGAGNATITVTAPGNDTYKEETATLTLTVNKRDVTVSLPGNINKTYGDAAFNLNASSTATLQDAPDITYNSSNTKVATVAKDGTVTIVGAGDATITACTVGTDNYNASNEATAALAVAKKQARITAPGKIDKTYGDEAFALGAKADPNEAGKLSYSSSNNAVATVSDNGTVTAIGAGECIITASLADSANFIGSRTETTLTVAKKNVAVNLDKSNYNADYGDNAFRLEATSNAGADAPNIVYSSSNPDVATVDNDGTVHVVKPGTCELSAKSNETANYNTSNEATATLTVNKGTIAIIAKSERVAEFDTAFNLDVHVDSSAAAPLEYESSNGDIASVNTEGLVTAKKSGTCTITVTMPENDYYQAAEKTISITVTKKPAGIDAPGKIQKTYGDKAFNLNATATDGLPLVYSSSNERVAVVDDNGTVTIAGAGTVKLTAETKGDKNHAAATATTTLTVAPAAQKAIIAKNSYAITYGTKTFSLKATAKTKLSFKSSNTKVAAVDAKGNVTAKGIGTCKITAIAANGNYTAASKSATVTVSPKSATIGTLKAGKKSLKATWKKSVSTNADGYQIRWSTAKKMTGSKSATIKSYKTASKNIQKLKAKKYYYVQVRVFKKAGGKTYYSGWSAAKKAKTK